MALTQALGSCPNSWTWINENRQQVNTQICQSGPSCSPIIVILQIAQCPVAVEYSTVGTSTNSTPYSQINWDQFYSHSPKPESSSVVSNSSTISLLFEIHIASVLDWGNQLVFISKTGKERRTGVTVKCSSGEFSRYSKRRGKMEAIVKKTILYLFMLTMDTKQLKNRQNLSSWINLELLAASKFVRYIIII